MDNHACSLEQTKTIQEYFDIIQREQEGINEGEMLRKSVPEHLRNSLLIYFTQTMVSNCSLFVQCEAGFLRRIMVSLEQRFYGSRHMVLTSSMPADGMYFIKKGIVELTMKSFQKSYFPNSHHRRSIKHKRVPNPNLTMKRIKTTIGYCKL